MNTLAELLRKHIGNNVEIARYGDDYALEDLDTNEVIIDTDVYDVAGVDDEPAIHKMTSSDLFTQMTETQRDDIYRMVWFDFVCDDVEDYLESEYNGDIPTDEDEFDALIQDIANDYVYNGAYNCNLDYWTNIWSLTKKHLERRNYGR